MNQINERRLPVWAWLWFPVVLYFGHYLCRWLLDPTVYDRFIDHESGFTETATLVLLAGALLIGIRVLQQAWATHDRRLLAFFSLFCLGCLYFLGEEASWGQHLFDWATPDAWKSLNNQNETNLHNASDLAGSLLDQLPRNLLSVAILVGGAILPLIRAARGITYDRGTFKAIVMPGMICVPAALIAPLASIPEKILDKSFGDVPWPFDIKAGEVKELMIAVFLLVYIVAVWREFDRRGKKG